MTEEFNGEKNMKNKKKKYKNSFELSTEETDDKQNENIVTNTKKKKKKKRCLEHDEGLCCSSEVTGEEPIRKKTKKCNNVDEDEYKPGMLSNILQKNKYGCVIVPWDPSFGTDLSYKQSSFEENNEQKEALKINPLFDLSKRHVENVVSGVGKDYKLFVGNLPAEVTVSKLKTIFKKCGKTQVKIRSERGYNFKNVNKSKKEMDSNISQKYALIRFDTFEGCKAALKINGKLLDGHHLRVTMAKVERNSDPEKSIFVGNLPFKIKDDDLWKVFERCGDIDNVRVIKNQLSGKGHFGYVNFKSATSVDEALKLDGISVLDRDIRVSRFRNDARSLSDLITVKRKKRGKLPKPKKNTNEEENEAYVMNNEVVREEQQESPTVQETEVHKKKHKRKKLKKSSLSANETYKDSQAN